MYGHTHAFGGLGAASLTAVMVSNPNVPTLVVASLLGAGMAVTPDLDTKGVASGSVGGFGFGINTVLAGMSKGFFWATKGRNDNPPAHTDGSHRTLTHTALFMALVGALFFFTVRYTFVLWSAFLLSFGVAALLPKVKDRVKKLGSLGMLAVMLGLSIGVYALWGNVLDYGVIGFAGIAALFSHRLLDLTTAGVPWTFAPLVPIRSKRWARYRLPIESGSTLANTLWKLLSLGVAGYAVYLFLNV